MKKSLVIGLGVLVIVAVGIVGYAMVTKERVRVQTMERSLTPISLAQESDLILIGTFQDGKSKILSDESSGDLVFTDWTVKPEEVWKGEAPSPLVVMVLGGENIKIQTVEDADLQVFRGMRALIYLKYIPEEKTWVPLSTRQGIFTEKEGQYIDANGKVYSRATLYDAVKAVKVN